MTAYDCGYQTNIVLEYSLFSVLPVVARDIYLLLLVLLLIHVSDK